jgi:hypothetical protein
MTSSLLESYATALQARAAAAPTPGEVRRAAVLLADFLHCRDGSPSREPLPGWAASVVERAEEASVSARAEDRDDVHWASLTHPGSVVWPVVTELGAAVGVAGPTRLAAATTGYATIAGVAVALGPEHGSIFHSTATAGTVAAAATAAVLLGLGEDRWPHALGHALSVIGGSRGALIEYSGTRCFHSAHAVRTGIAAALAAARGLDATRSDLDRRQGALATLDPDRLLTVDDDALAESSLRVFPTSGWNQAAYEAGFTAARDFVSIGCAQGAAGHAIDSITIQTPSAPPSGVAEAVAAAIVAAVPDSSLAGLPDLIQLRPDTGVTAVQIRARERSAESAVAVPLDHPSRTADLTQLAAWKWHCSADAATERVERLAAELTGTADKEQA